MLKFMVKSSNLDKWFIQITQVVCVVLVWPVMTYPLDNSNNVDNQHHGVLDGLHPDQEDYDEYHYDNDSDDDPQDQEENIISSLPLSKADQKMAEILNSLPMITTKAPKM